MMRLLLSVFLAALIFIACEKNEDSADSQVGAYPIMGQYTGYFHRSGMDTAKVGISFNDRGRYEGNSAVENYPAVCRGSFTTTANTISFGDSCTWRADFDWTLILNGTYNIAYKDANTIRIYKSNGNITDEYVLTKGG